MSLLVLVASLMNMWKCSHHQLTKRHQRQSFFSSVVTLNQAYQSTTSAWCAESPWVNYKLCQVCVSFENTIVKATDIISAVNYAVYHNVHGIHEIYTRNVIIIIYLAINLYFILLHTYNAWASQEGADRVKRGLWIHWYTADVRRIHWFYGCLRYFRIWHWLDSCAIAS